jgi:hypothetical protein
MDNYNNLTRNGDQIEVIEEKNKQKKRFDKYTKTNHFASKAGMKDVIKMATGMPNVFYKGPSGDLNTVDDESSLLIGSLQTKSKCKLNLQKRKYVTVPYLANKKTAKDYIKERHYMKGDFWRAPKFKFRSFLKKEKGKQYGEDNEGIEMGRNFILDNPHIRGQNDDEIELKLQRGSTQC